MGLFNNIVRKASRIISDSIENKIVDEVRNSVNDAFDIKSNNIKNYTIPEKYNIFPKYEGSIIQKPTQKNTNNYSRITIRYNGSPNSQYISTLIQNGFIQASPVRYDKGNTYVIVDNLGNKTEIVYHIKN